MKFPEHQAALHLIHNDHKNMYQSVEQWIEEHNEFYECRSPEEKQRAIELNEVWTLQWYPDTPIGFHAVAAPTLSELILFANEED